MKSGNKNTVVLLVLLLVGLVIGGVIGEIFKDSLSILNYGKAIGVDPFTVDLGILTFTLGLKLYINISSILGLLITLFIYSRL